MTALIVAAGIVLFALVFIVRTIMHNGSSKSIAVEVPRHGPQSLLSADMRIMMDEAETKVFRKADVIARMADDDLGMVVHPEEPPKDHLEETSFMRAISDKVDQVKRISGVKS